MARDVLAEPPPLTPANQREFPYLARSFPFATLVAGAGLARLKSETPGVPHNSAEDPVE